MAAQCAWNAGSGSRIRWFCRVARPAVLLVLACASLPGIAAADYDGSQLSLVSGAPTAALVSTGGGTLAPATADVLLTVRNDAAAGGRLQISLLLADGRVVLLGVPTTTVTIGTNKAQAALVSAPASPGSPASPLKIRARGVVRLRLKLTVTPPQPFAGMLVVAVAGSRAVSPLAVPLTVALAQPVTWTNAQLEPSAVTVNVPGCWPAILHSDCPGTDPQDVSAEGIVATGQVAAGTVLATAVASSDSGGRAKVTVRAAKHIAVGATSAKLEVDVTHVEKYGTYETAVPLVPGADDSPKLSVKTIARDFWLWPLLVLLLGTLLAYWLLGRREQQRPREVLQLAILETTGRYRVARERRENDVHVPYWLDDLFPRREDRWQCGCVGKSTPRALELYCNIADATTQEQLDEYTAAVADLDARVRNWPRACCAATALRSACEALKDADKDLSKRMLAACHALDDPDDVPVDAAASAEQIALLEQQCAAAGHWLTAHALLVQAETLCSSLQRRIPEERKHDRKLLLESSPAVYRDELREADSLDTLEESSIARLLREDLRVLRGLSHAYPAPRRELAQRAELEEAAPDMPLRARVAAVAQVAKTVAAPFAIVQTDEAAQSLRRIVRQDKVDAAVVFLITVLAYFVTIYPGGAFGSVWQYLVAFAAGAGGQVAVNWQLLPWYRSYRPKLPSGGA